MNPRRIKADIHVDSNLALVLYRKAHSGPCKLESEPDTRFAIEWHPFQLKPRHAPPTAMDRTRPIWRVSFGGKGTARSGLMAPVGGTMPEKSRAEDQF